MARVSSGGVEIAYDIMNENGAGVPVFFLAGLNGMRQACMKQAIPFSRERPVIVQDQRGTGESDKPRGVYSVGNFAKDVIAIMDAAGIERAHMVGTSTGGAIAQVLASTTRSGCKARQSAALGRGATTSSAASASHGSSSVACT